MARTDSCATEGPRAGSIRVGSTADVGVQLTSVFAKLCMDTAHPMLHTYLLDPDLAERSPPSVRRAVDLC